MTTRSHCLLFHKRSTDWDSPLGYKQVISHYTRRISLLLTLVLGFASDSCNNNDILLVVGYNYNLLSIYCYCYNQFISNVISCRLTSGGSRNSERGFQLIVDPPPAAEKVAIFKSIKSNEKSNIFPIDKLWLATLTYSS